MANKQSVNWLSGQRVDIPDLRSIESGVIFDFKVLLQAFVGNVPYILNGFTIPVSGISGPATSLQMVVDGATVWIPSDTNGSFLRVDTGTANETLSPANPKLVGSFSPGSNYISLRFKRATDPTTADLVSIWDVDAKTEFTITAPRGLVMDYEIVIDGATFGSNAPVAIVQVSGSNVTSIENAKQGLFRLGSGGATPDINHEQDILVNPENNLIATSNSDPDPFAGGDWEFTNFKKWMDRVMTEFKRLKNSVFWYSDAPVAGINLLDLYEDAVGSVMTGKGVFKHDMATAGLLTWTSDLLIRNIIGPKTYTIAAGSIAMAERQVAYVELVRNEDFQPANTFTFTSGAPTITGALAVSGIAAGDFIKSLNDPANAWREVLSVIGNTITLTDNYPASSVQKALRADGGPYTMSVADPENVPANSNMYWVAKREEVTQTATIDTIGNSGAQRTNDIATIKTTAAHGFVEGQTVEITVASDSSFNGFAEILTVPSATTFTYTNEGADVGSGVAGGGSVDVAAKIYLRWFGDLDQGEERQIDDQTTINMLQYVGSPSEMSTVPSYPAPYRTIKLGANLTSGIGQIDTEINKFFGQLRLTTQSPNSTIVEISAVGPVMLDETVLGQEISGFLMAFIGATIDFSTGIILDANAVALGVNFTPETIPANEWLWYSVSLIPGAVTADNRMNVQVLVNAADTTDAVKDNAARANFTGTIKIGQVAVQDDGSAGVGTIEDIAQEDIVQLFMGAGSGGSGITIAKYLDPIATVLPVGVSYIVDGSAAVDDDLILFTNLTTGNNRIYKISGVGIAISFAPQFVFNGLSTPLAGMLTAISNGLAFNGTVANFTGTQWLVNDRIRLFDGVSADFWELTSIKSTNITNNTTANIFTVNVAGSENFMIMYSVTRAAGKETGMMIISATATDAGMSWTGSKVVLTGIEFNASVTAGVLSLDYTTDASGSAGSVKYWLARWSDTAGGPSTIPSYSSGPSFSGSETARVEYRTLSGPEAAASQLTLSFLPNDVTKVMVDPIGGTAQMYGVDYTVAGQVLDWSGLGMDSLPLVAGNVLRILYWTT